MISDLPFGKLILATVCRMDLRGASWGRGTNSEVIAIVQGIKGEDFNQGSRRGRGRESIETCVGGVLSGTWFEVREKKTSGMRAWFR